MLRRLGNMKTSRVFYLAVLTFLFIGCGGGEEALEPTKQVKGIECIVTGRTDCKVWGEEGEAKRDKGRTMGVAETDTCNYEIEDCVEYTYSGDTLSITHVNSAFNCCPKEILVNASVSGDTIVIVERESEGLCDCICLYDLDIEVLNLIPSKYTVVIKEQYICKGDEPVIFPLDLTGGTSGSFCFKRSCYPWR